MKQTRTLFFVLLFFYSMPTYNSQQLQDPLINANPEIELPDAASSSCSTFVTRQAFKSSKCKTLAKNYCITCCSFGLFAGIITLIAVAPNNSHRSNPSVIICSTDSPDKQAFNMSNSCFRYQGDNNNNMLTNKDCFDPINSKASQVIEEIRKQPLYAKSSICLVANNCDAFGFKNRQCKAFTIHNPISLSLNNTGSNRDKNNTDNTQKLNALAQRNATSHKQHKLKHALLKRSNQTQIKAQRKVK